MSAPNPSNPTSQPDETLVAEARRGVAAAFTALVTRYQDRVFNMAKRMLSDRQDAEDISQEVFLTAYKALDRFEERARFSTWLYRITVNKCRDEIRRRGSVKHTRPGSLGVEGFEPAAPAGSPSDQAVAHELEHRIEIAIGELPDDVREVLLLRDTEDFAYEEIARIVDVPVGTVRSRLNRARTLLKDRLAPLIQEQDS